MAEKETGLRYFPIPMFATTMGLSGLTMITGKMEAMLLSTDGTIYQTFAYVTLAVYLTILATYTLKSMRYPQAVIADWTHPIKISFFPAASISLLLLGAIFYDINHNVSFFLWATGCFFQFFLSLAIINSWITHERYEVGHNTPAWFIPAVGNIIVPVAGVHHASPELSWFFFAWGLMFWFILLVLVMNRLMFHNPIPQKLLPTLFVLLAPPSIGFVSYIQLVGELDLMGRLLYYWAAFFFLLLASQVTRMWKIQFAMSWWAYTFPLAAFTSATQLMGELTGQIFFLHSARTLYVITFVVVALLIYRTIRGLLKGQICIPD